MARLTKLVLPAVIAASMLVPAVAQATTTVSQDSVGGPVTITGDADGTVTGAEGYEPTTFRGNDLALAPGSTCTLTSAPAVTPVTIDCSTHSITANLGDSADSIYMPNVSGSVTMTTVVHGGGGDDTITGSPKQDQLYGDGGNDHLRALEGADTVDGGPGDDELDGGPGTDTFFGGADDDLITSDNLYGDPDTDGDIDCGSGVDIDASPDPGGAITGCERELPWYASATGATLTAEPVAGYGYGSGSFLDAAPEGSTPDYQVIQWYLCTDAVETQNIFGAINSACHGIGSGTPIGVPSNSVGKYLGAVVAPGLQWKTYMSITNWDGSTGTTARKIVAGAPRGAPGGPGNTTIITVALSLAKSFKCGSSKCSLSATASGNGTFTTEPAAPGTSKKPSLVARSFKSAQKPGKVALPVKLTSAGKKHLKKKRKLKVKVRVSFRPMNEPTVVQTSTTTLSYKLKK